MKCTSGNPARACHKKKQNKWTYRKAKIHPKNSPALRAGNTPSRIPPGRAERIGPLTNSWRRAKIHPKMFSAALNVQDHPQPAGRAKKTAGACPKAIKIGKLASILCTLAGVSERGLSEGAEAGASAARWIRIGN